MSTAASPAAFTISGTICDCLKAFPFFIILIDSLTVLLFINQGTMPETNYPYPM